MSTSTTNNIMDELGVPLPRNFESYDSTTKEHIIAYIKHLSDIEKTAYTIALNHLGSSFNIVKSNGYVGWFKRSLAK